MRTRAWGVRRRQYPHQTGSNLPFEGMSLDCVYRFHEEADILGDVSRDEADHI